MTFILVHLVDEVDKHRNRVSQGCRASRHSSSTITRAGDVENIVAEFVELIYYSV
jgi:hypothetical protein